MCRFRLPVILAILLCLFGLVSLVGCSSPPGVSVCPPTVKYDNSFKLKLVSELHQLGEGSAVAQIVKDYSTLKQEVEACQSSGK
jgi:hypothetical protein